MLTEKEFISLPYTPDLTLAGISYACRSLSHTYNRMGGTKYNRLRRIVGGKAVELAFRRYLIDQQVPFDNLGATPFTDPDQYDIALGGRRCDVKSFQIIRRGAIRRIRKDPAALLDAAALVPADQLNRSDLEDKDLYIFSFLLALLAPTTEDTQQALEAGQPVYLVHTLPQTWSQPEHWSSLGGLVLKANTSEPIKVEVGGQGKERNFLVERLELNPGLRTPAKQDFYTLNYLHPDRSPDGMIGIHSPRLKDTHLAKPKQWGNIWVYGMEILLVGHITRGEFRRQARYLPAGSRVQQYPKTRTANWTVPVHDLHPISDLLDKTRRWHGRA